MTCVCATSSESIAGAFGSWVAMPLMLVTLLGLTVLTFPDTGADTVVPLFKPVIGLSVPLPQATSNVEKAKLNIILEFVIIALLSSKYVFARILTNSYATVTFSGLAVDCIDKRLVLGGQRSLRYAGKDLCLS